MQMRRVSSFFGTITIGLPLEGSVTPALSRSLPSGVPPASQEHDMVTVGKKSGRECESDVVPGMSA